MLSADILFDCEKETNMGPNYRGTKLPWGQITMGPNYHGTKLPWDQITGTKLPGTTLPGTKLQGFQIDSPSNRLAKYPPPNRVNTITQ